MVNNSYYNPYPYGQVGNYNQNSYLNNQYQPQMNQNNQNNNSGNLMTISVTTEDEVNNYPVAAGMTVMLISFNLKKFWLKSTNTSGIPEPIRVFPFEEEAQIAPQPQESGVTREEFNALVKNVEKLINDLGGE